MRKIKAQVVADDEDIPATEGSIRFKTDGTPLDMEEVKKAAEATGMTEEEVAKALKVISERINSGEMQASMKRLRAAEGAMNEALAGLSKDECSMVVGGYFSRTIMAAIANNDTLFNDPKAHDPEAYKDICVTTAEDIARYMKMYYDSQGGPKGIDTMRKILKNQMNANGETLQ